MSKIADMVELMLAEGASAVAIGIAVRALETVTAVTRDIGVTSRVTKRDGNKKRQAARRERMKLQQLATEARANDGVDGHALVTRDSVTAANGVVVLSLQGRGLSVEEESKKVRKTERVRARGTRLESGAPLTEEFRQVALDLGAHADEIQNAWAEFVDYWIGVPGSRGTKLDWLATWRNRIRDILKRGKPRGNSNGRRTVHDAARDLSARVRALDEPAPELCDGTGGSPLRLIPSR